MGRKYAIRDQHQLHFVTFTIVSWVDLFIRNEYKEIIIESLKYCQKNKGLFVHAYCIMTSHVHLILSTDEGHRLSDVIRDMKSHTSQSIRKLIESNPNESRKGWMKWIFESAGKFNNRNKDFQFWQQHNHPIELDNNKMIDQRLDYVHNNPVEAGFVAKPEDWIWSSAGQYAGMDGMLDLEYL